MTTAVDLERQYGAQVRAAHRDQIQAHRAMQAAALGRARELVHTADRQS